MPLNRYFKLYLNAGRSIPLVINASQNDSGEQWYFSLFTETGEQYYPSAGAIVGIKCDGKLIDNEATVDSRGYVIVTETAQMTAVPGKNTFELQIDSHTHGTANFIVLVEPSPTNGGVLSDSDLSLFQQAINSIAIAGSGAPAVATTASEMTDTGKIYLYAGSETGYTAGDWYYYNGSAWTDGGKYGGTVDATLTIPGAAADAKKTGDELSDLKSQIALLSGVPTAVKNAIDTLFQNVAFKNDDVYTDELAVVHNWATAVNLLSISAVFEQGENVIYDNDSLDDLRQYLTVTASYDNGTSGTVTGYTLSGELTVGACTITVSYGGKTASFTVVVTAHNPLVALKGYTCGPVSGSANISLLGGYNTRAVMVYDNGEHPYPPYSSTVLDSDYYPVPIPQGTTNMVVTMPNDLYVGVRSFVWDSARNYYDNTNGLSSPWTASANATFDVSNYNDGTWFAGFTFKVGTAGTTDMTNYDMSGVSISFN